MNSHLIGYECDTASDGLEEQLARKSGRKKIQMDSFHESTQRAERRGLTSSNVSQEEAGLTVILADDWNRNKVRWGSTVLQVEPLVVAVPQQ